MSIARLPYRQKYRYESSALISTVARACADSPIRKHAALSRGRSVIPYSSFHRPLSSVVLCAGSGVGAC